MNCFMYVAVTTTYILSLLLYVCGLASEFSLNCFMYEAVTIHHIPLFSPICGLGGEFSLNYLCMRL